MQDVVPEVVTSFIDGAFVAPGDGRCLPVHNPASGAPISALVEADVDEVDRAVGAARRAFDRTDWPAWPLERRQELLYAIGDAVHARADELARLECLDTGIVLRELQDRHIRRAAYNFRFFAEFIAQSAGQLWAQNPAYQTLVTREPAGVAALIAPWNAPLALASMKIAAALAFGNTAVVKPSEQTPLSLARFVALAHEAGVPPGVLNLVNGRGPVTGQALVDHPGVDRISFTGGTETGRRIAEAAGRRLKPVTLELGGKSANIVFASADLDRALDGALLGIFSNNGQQCLAGSRILVERPVADAFIGRFVERARRLVIGDPMAPDTEIGPLASAAQRARVLGFAGRAEAEGCRLLLGGTAPAELGSGYYVAPTAVLAPSSRVAVAQQEIFGPFATFLVFDGVAEALALANDTPYGLVGYVWSDHLPTVTAATRGLKAGVVWVNTPMMRELRAPFGGVKDSGLGREGGQSCLAFYTEEKTVTLPTEPLALRRLGA